LNDLDNVAANVNRLAETVCPSVPQTVGSCRTRHEDSYDDGSSESPSHELYSSQQQVSHSDLCVEKKAMVEINEDGDGLFNGKVVHFIINTRWV